MTKPMNFGRYFVQSVIPHRRTAASTTVEWHRLCRTFPVVIIVMMVHVMVHSRGHQHKHHHHYQLVGCSALTGADFSYLPLIRTYSINIPLIQSVDIARAK